MFAQKTVPVFAATIAAFALAAPGYAQTMVSSTEAGFSYPLPAGWSAQTVPQSEYTVALVATRGGFTPNINVVREAFVGTVDAYFKASKKAFGQVPTARIVSETRFTTKSGVRGWKMVYTNTM
ncbi:MAG: hypothetical protein H7Y38_05565 [Armatimonadetes bacterium]|nr:hypothetical protein [Armatimonadota bacterium]